MRALVFLFSLSILFPALALPSLASEVLVSKSAEPTCYTIIRQFGTERRIPGYETYYRVSGHKSLFHRHCDFLGNPEAVMSDIAMPLRYDDMVNTGGVNEAQHVKVLPNGHIKLY